MKLKILIKNRKGLEKIDDIALRLASEIKIVREDYEITIVKEETDKLEKIKEIIKKHYEKE